MNNKPLTPFTFPIWWYTEGLQLAARHAQEKYKYILRSTGLLIFLRNMTQPLYGDYTRSGRIISFFLRVFLLLFILIWTLLRIVFAFLVLGLHLVALPLVIVMIIFQLFQLFV
jgi:hypothetical protein